MESLKNVANDQKLSNNDKSSSSSSSSKPFGPAPKHNSPFPPQFAGITFPASGSLPFSSSPSALPDFTTSAFALAQPSSTNPSASPFTCTTGTDGSSSNVFGFHPTSTSLGFFPAAFSNSSFGTPSSSPPFPSPSTFNPTSAFSITNPINPRCFSDDDPIIPHPTSSPNATTDTTSPSHSQRLATLKALPEYPALNHQSNPSFAVLVSVKGPSLDVLGAAGFQRPPVDLVAVLDVSGSMQGLKIDLVKRGVRFIVENLGPDDRLSIVCFDSQARRITSLRRMEDSGKEEAISAISSVRAAGGTDIVRGLEMAIKVLQYRRTKNPVSSVLLLSDGCDNFASGRHIRSRLPHSICPVHAFGFGSDHDSAALHTIADASGGTFSYIESLNVIQDAFARCVGGLLSVVSQRLQILLQSATKGVEIQRIPASGRYSSGIDYGSSIGIIDVGDLYADEEKSFLVYLTVPEADASDEKTTALLDVSCKYMDPIISKKMIEVDGIRVEIRRRELLSSADREVNLEVDKQRNRILVIEGIADAQAKAERGDLEGAQALLQRAMSKLLSTDSAKAGDELCSRLEVELREITALMSNMMLYEGTGRAYALAGLSSYSNQRASTRGVGPMGGAVFGAQLQQCTAVSTSSIKFGGSEFSSTAFRAPGYGSSAATNGTASSFGGGGEEQSGSAIGFETPMMARMVRRSQTSSPKI